MTTMRFPFQTLSEKAPLAEGPQNVVTNSPTASRVKVALFFLAFFVFTAVVIGIGIYRRDATLALGGKSKVTVINTSKERLRADLTAGPQVATLELAPGEQETVRFSPHEPLVLETNVLKYGRQMITIKGPPLTPDGTTSATLNLRGDTAYSLDFRNE